MRPLLIAFLVLLAGDCCAQSGFLIHKKGNKTVRTYFAGSYITFQTHHEQWITGLIKKIRSDSVHVQMMQVRMLGGPGIAIADTGYSAIMRLHYKDILAFEKDACFSFIGNGIFFKIGAVGYATLNIANGLIYKEPLFDNENSRRLLTAAGVFLFGQVLRWTYSPVNKIGRKHKLVFVDLPPPEDNQR